MNDDKLHFFVLQNAVSQIVGPMILNSATVRDVHTLDDFYRALNWLFLEIEKDWEEITEKKCILKLKEMEGHVE